MDFVDGFQRAGMTVQAERLNYLRFISHFRAVHRGASFAGLRTTSVRKLLPEYIAFPPLLLFYFIYLFIYYFLFFVSIMLCLVCEFRGLKEGKENNM